VDENTSIGPAESPPAAGEKRQGDAAGNEVDAQSANEFDTRHNLAGAESKPFAKPSPAKPSAGNDTKAPSSQPADDPNGSDPNRRADLIDERRNPGAHGGGGDPGWKKS